MDYRFLGATGLKVSELCLGGLTFGRESSEACSRQILDHFVGSGGNFIDTADIYSLGGSEEIIGRWLTGQRRDDLVIATKARFPMSSGPNDAGAGRKHIFASVEASLRRLQTGYIDLYQVHCWDDATPLEETLRTLNTLVQQGKIRYVGASNFSGWQLQKAVLLSRQHDWEPLSCMQPQYNLLCRAPEWEVLPVCVSEGLGVIPWSPLRGGWLSGKYRRNLGRPPADSRVATADREGWDERWSAYDNDRTWSLLDILQEVAGNNDKEPAQVAINWLLQKPGVTAPIIGARSVEQLHSNLGGSGWKLDPESMMRLDEASALPKYYPYDFIPQQSRR